MPRTPSRALARSSAFRLGLAAACLTAIATGCATNLPKPSIEPQPPSVRLGSFREVTLAPAPIAEEYAGSSANQKAAAKINELLARDVRLLFPQLEVSDTAPARGLYIRPEIVAIKFIGGAARFWVGAMAGSSAVLVRVTLTDAASGDKLGEAEYYRSAGAYGGAWSVGAADNRMLDDIAGDVVDYLRNSR